MGINKQDWNGHKEKDEIRDDVCTYNGSPYNNVLLIPSGSMLDFKLLVKNGCITKETFIFAIERNKKIAEIIKNKLTSEDYKHKVICQELHKIDLTKELEGNKLDFVYLDTCSTLNRHILGWIFNLSQTGKDNFDPQCDFNIAFACCKRESEDFGFTKVILKNKFSGLNCKLPSRVVGTDWNSNKEDYITLLNALKIIGKPYKTMVYKNAISRHTMFSFSFKGFKGNSDARILDALSQANKNFSSFPVKLDIRSNGLKAYCAKKGISFDKPSENSHKGNGILAWKTRYANTAQKLRGAIKMWISRKKLSEGYDKRCYAQKVLENNGIPSTESYSLAYKIVG